MRLNPAIEDAPSYPFLRLAEARGAAQAQSAEIVDLSLGQPTDPAPRAVRDALAHAAAALSLCDYPSTEGLHELRETIAAWVAQRFGVTVDPSRELLPTLGAKEPIALLARLFARAGDAIAVTSPSYPIPARSARAAGLPLAAQLLSAATDWLPDPDAIPWGKAAIVWVVNPHNPSGAIATLELLEELAERCRRSGAILACDETYSELWFERPPASGLQLEDRSGVVVFNSLSKRSGLAGLRSGFIAGDPEILSRIRRHRSDIGTTPPAIVQHASIAAWSDEEHVRAARSRYASKRRVLAAATRRAGLEHVGGTAGIFLWLRVPDGDDTRMFERLLVERSLLTMPGSYLGAGGEGHLRVALTPTTERIALAAKLFEAGTAVVA